MLTSRLSTEGAEMSAMTWMTTYPDVFGAVLFVALFLSFWLGADKD